MTGSPAYQVRFSEPAAAVRDRLDARRRARFERGVALLARDPFPDRARLTVLYVAAFDDTDVLVPEE